MRLLLPEPIADRIRVALERAGKREVGGILMGEHLGEDLFSVADLTIQFHGGTFASFVRLLESVLAPLQRFFRATSYEYERFNYLGEWHSHHSFRLVPSPTDDASMLDIVTDSEVGARFVALLIVRLSEAGELDCSVTVYLPSGVRYSGEVLRSRGS